MSTSFSFYPWNIVFWVISCSWFGFSYQVLLLKLTTDSWMFGCERSVKGKTSEEFRQLNVLFRSALHRTHNNLQPHNVTHTHTHTHTHKAALVHRSVPSTEAYCLHLSRVLGWGGFGTDFNTLKFTVHENILLRSPTDWLDSGRVHSSIMLTDLKVLFMCLKGFLFTSAFSWRLPNK